MKLILASVVLFSLIRPSSIVDWRSIVDVCVSSELSIRSLAKLFVNRVFMNEMHSDHCFLHDLVKNGSR